MAPTHEDLDKTASMMQPRRSAERASAGQNPNTDLLPQPPPIYNLRSRPGSSRRHLPEPSSPRSLAATPFRAKLYNDDHYGSSKDLDFHRFQYRGCRS